MWLQAPHAERKAHVTHIAGDVSVKTARFFQWSDSPASQLDRFLADAIIDYHAFALQFGIPVRHLNPVGEGRKLHIRLLVTRVEIVVIAVALAIGSDIANHPGVDPAVAGFLDFVFPVRTLQLYLARFGKINLQPVFANGNIFRESVLVPELIRSKRSCDMNDRVVLEHISRMQVHD